MQYSFTFTPTNADYNQASAFMRGQLFDRKSRAINFVMAVLLGIGLMAPIAFLTALAGEFVPPELRDYPLYAELALVAMLLVLVAYIKCLRAYQARKLYAKGSYLLETKQATINAEAVQFSGKISTHTLPWPLVSRIAECKKHFYFFADNSCAFFLPKSALAEAANMDEFRHQIRHWHKAAREAA